MRDYYRALDAKDFQGAWSRLSESARSEFGGFDAWSKAYDSSLSQSLTSVTADANDATHATVTVSLRSLDLDACGDRVTQRWQGAWTMARPAGHWEARAVSMSRTGGQTLVTDASACPTSTPDATASAPSGSGTTTQVCYPGFTIQAVTIPAVTIAATTIPGFTLNGVRYPAQHIAALSLPARHLPARQVDKQCFDAPSSFTLDKTTLLADDAYTSVDPSYSLTLTQRYRSSVGSSGSYPDPTAPGFGELNGAGYPKNQYVRPYIRRDGTAVTGYWRNSPSDGLPTCRVISC